MNITVNAVEVASELAHHRTLYESDDLCNNEDDMYINPNAAILVYTDRIQNRFNEWYDFYFEIITNLAHIK